MTLLGRSAITTDELRAFRRWKRDARNAAAFAEIERTFGKVEALRNDPEIARATAAVLGKQHQQSPAGRLVARHPVLAATAVVVVLLAGVGVAWPLATTTTYASAIGEQRRIQLADGSRLTLDTDSSASVRITRAARRVALKRGRALFEVAHDATRPFTVSADGTETRAIGTRFTVTNLRGAVTVTLVQGSVEVRSERDARPSRLNPGQQIVVVDRHEPAKVSIADIGAATSWTTGRLVFRDKPLAGAIDEVNRYSKKKVVLGASEFSDTRISGFFDAGDTTSFAVGVAEFLDLKTKTTDDGSIVLEK